MVSLPRRKRDSGIIVSVGLSRRLESPRVSASAEPYPGRWTNHVPVGGEEQIGDELLGCLREAWDFAQSKG